MKLITASAPGKAVLTGEYAVLDGSPAVSMAVSRRARVTIEPHDQDWHSVIAPGFSDTEGRFRAGRDNFEWLAGGDSYALVEQVCREVNRSFAGNLSYVLDTQEFIDPECGVKVGIGSSAALATALATAMCASIAPNIDTTRVATAAHRRFQHGAGSGVDVACCSNGGVIEYRMDRGLPLQLEWPEGLVFALLWSGVVSSTAAKLDQLERCGVQQSRANLGHAAELAAAAWRSGSARRVLDACRTYTQSLRLFSVDHDLGIFDAGHSDLVDAANDMGLVYKPCGAGGGDIGIVLATDAAAIASLIASPVAAGFKQLNVTIDRHGAQLVREKL